jgi:hypothetical protein
LCQLAQQQHNRRLYPNAGVSGFSPMQKVLMAMMVIDSTFCRSN